jgi:hypothetical protein
MIDRCRKCGRIVSAADPNVRYDRRGWAHRICRGRKLKRGERKRRRLATMSRKGWDLEARAARNFADPKSRVLQDGREILYGPDWFSRHIECLTAAHYRCVRCGKLAVHAHHKVHRAKLRDDRMQNLEAICFGCHQGEHPEKQTQFKEAKCQT